MHRYTPEEVEFLKQNYKGRDARELTELFNDHFSHNLKQSQVKAAVHNRGFKCGKDFRFKPGHIPYNKGVKGIRVSIATEFKPGHMPVNHKPVGSERINRNGYIEIKIREPRTWAAKHRVIWEKANGPIPKGHVILFADGNKLNLSLDNLLIVSRGELAVMNHENLIYKNKELTRSGQLIAALKIKIRDRNGRNSCSD